MQSRFSLVLCSALLVSVAGAASADRGFSGNLQGSQEVPPTGAAGAGTGFVILDSAEAQITVLMSFSGLTGNATAGHIHGPAPAGSNAGVLFNLSPPAVMAGAIVPQTFAITPQQASDVKAGLWYFNIHTALNPGGEIRGQISAARTFTAHLQGTQEVPPNASPGIGYGAAVLDKTNTTLAVTLGFSGLLANATAGHIHGPAAAGANAAVIFPLTPPGAMSGSVTPAMFAITPAQVTDLVNGLNYFNIHTSVFPGGETRGQLSLAKYYSGAPLSGAAEVPPNASTGTGVGSVALEDFETTITAMLTFSGLSANATAGHIHGPAAAGSNAAVIFPFTLPAAPSGSIAPTMFTITPTQVTDLKNGLHYFNIHTSTFPGGEIRSQITTVTEPVELLQFSVD